MTISLARPALLVAALACGSAAAAPPVLRLPVDCRPGTDCWVVNYVDVDPADDGATDFRCGPRTYDGHKGTDIAVRDRAAMERGVDVLAAAAGTVLRRRDGMSDADHSRRELERIRRENRNCGNGVVMEHGDGWQTQYCHLKRGSIAVSPGDAVEAGDRIGQVGNSGYVEFPHLHISVSRNREIIEPFTGMPASGGCGGDGAALWKPDQGVRYEPVSLYASGFRDAVPEFDRVRHDAGSPDAMSRNADALTYWVLMFGVRVGDRIHMRIEAPDGSVFAERDIVQERERARQFYFIGSRARSGLEPGSYTGTVVLERTGDGAPLRREISRRLEVE